MRHRVRFAVTGLDHRHIYHQTDCMLAAGAEAACYYTPEGLQASKFAAVYPDIPRADTLEQVLEDERIQLVLNAGIPHERAPMGIRVMRHGKDYMVDKPGFTTLAQLQEAREVQADTGRIYSVCYSGRLLSRSTTKASELVTDGAIGKVIQTISMGPHMAKVHTRPGWFFEKEKYGGILTDIGSHHVDQFLHFTGSTSAKIVSAQVANLNHSQYPEFEDFGDVVVHGNNGLGYFRVDWFTPDGLGVWGDDRLFILGTDGYIELRKQIDVAGRPGSEHLFLVDHRGIQHFDCKEVDLPYGQALIDDIIYRTETAMTQEHSFLAMELALQAEAVATHL